jgi:hypothetical protein
MVIPPAGAALSEENLFARNYFHANLKAHEQNCLHHPVVVNSAAGGFSQDQIRQDHTHQHRALLFLVHSGSDSRAHCNFEVGWRAVRDRFGGAARNFRRPAH